LLVLQLLVYVSHQPVELLYLWLQQMIKKWAVFFCSGWSSRQNQTRGRNLRKAKEQSADNDDDGSDDDERYKRLSSCLCSLFQ